MLDIKNSSIISPKNLPKQISDHNYSSTDKK